MAREVVVHRARQSGSRWTVIRPAAGAEPARWEIAGDGSHAVWWQWLDVPAGSRPRELAACWFRLDDLGMGLGLYLPRRFGARAIAVDDELLNVVRLIDLEGWSRSNGQAPVRRRARPQSRGPAATEERSRPAGGQRRTAVGSVARRQAARCLVEHSQTDTAMMAWRQSAVLVAAEAPSLRKLADDAFAQATGLVESVLRLADMRRLLALTHSR